jgi:hypothetical protein
MNNFKTRLTTAIATGSVLLHALAPVTFAQTTIEISGNGAGSDNSVNVTRNMTTTVNQTNNAVVKNSVEADADTGNNDANFNTGGNVTVSTGNANITANVSNNLNKNVAQVDCCAAAGNTDVKISGNGAFSNNTVNLTQNSTTTLNQNNYAKVDNDVDADADTGDNEAGFNTGNGSVTIRTGNATVNATVNTTANVNWAQVGGNQGGAGNVSLMILDNGAGSDNTINATLSNTTNLNQYNSAHVDNDVEADADTGDNDANFNTGDGDVVVDTGNAEVNATIDNMVNFNAADVDCGCVFGGLLAKIAGNGAVPGFSSNDDNVIKVTLGGLQNYNQNNRAHLNNDLDELTTDTGDNEASMNTAGSNGDPTVVTGNAKVNAGVSNEGNHNILGNVTLPELPEIDLDFNWSAFWAFFGMFLHN